MGLMNQCQRNLQPIVNNQPSVVHRSLSAANFVLLLSRLGSQLLSWIVSIGMLHACEVTLDLIHSGNFLNWQFVFALTNMCVWTNCTLGDRLQKSHYGTHTHTKQHIRKSIVALKIGQKVPLLRLAHNRNGQANGMYYNDIQMHIVFSVSLSLSHFQCVCLFFVVFPKPFPRRSSLNQTTEYMLHTG